METQSGNDGSMNLSKYLSASGVCSRRGAAELVASGVVSVNGTPARSPAERVAQKDRVTVRGKVVSPVREYVYIMLHKPRGYVCTMEDPHAKKKAVDLIPLSREVRIVSAGRLDKDSEGLILFSNDGSFIARMTHPRYEVRKIYRVSTDGDLSPEAVRRLTHEGVRSGGDLLKAERVERQAPGKYEFTLHEGKNREVRRMLEACGRETRRLKRVAIGGLRLGGLPPGAWRFLSTDEVRLALGDPSGSHL